MYPGTKSGVYLINSRISFIIWGITIALEYVKKKDHFIIINAICCETIVRNLKYNTAKFPLKSHKFSIIKTKLNQDILLMLINKNILFFKADMQNVLHYISSFQNNIFAGFRYVKQNKYITQ